jgi:hypothetical protein
MTRQAQKPMIVTLSVAILGLVSLSVVVIAVLQDKRMDGMEYFSFGGLGALIAGGIASYLVYYKRRIGVTVRGNNKQLSLEVADPDLPLAFSAHYPFTVSMQWTDSHLKASHNMKMLYLTITDQKGKHLVTFCTALGTIIDPPHDSEYINLLKEGESSKLKISDCYYETSKAEDIRRELTQRIRYIEMRLKREAEAKQRLAN